MLVQAKDIWPGALTKWSCGGRMTVLTVEVRPGTPRIHCDMRDEQTGRVTHRNYAKNRVLEVVRA